MTTVNNDAYGEFLNPREVRLTRLLPAPIERVWTYLTDSEKRATWLASGPMDLRPGGKVELHFDHAKISGEAPPDDHRGSCGDSERHIIAVQPPNLLSFTWGASEVTFQLSTEANSTRLVLTHRRLESAEQAAGVSAGWHVHLAVLIARLSGQQPPAFWSTHSRLETYYAAQIEAMQEPLASA
jgi:uncharacterized protein YndB with AHSA1/START domain